MAKLLAVAIVFLVGSVCLADPFGLREVKPRVSYQVTTMRGVVFITEVEIDGFEYLILDDKFMLPKSIPAGGGPRVVGRK